MDFLKSIAIAASGLRAQAGRIRIISENIANADSTAANSQADPYRRRIPTFRSSFDKELQANVVHLGKIQTDKSDFIMKNEPGNPAADARGNVKYPNVNTLIETVDMREAQRSYEADLSVMESTKQMLAKTVDLLNK